MQCHEFENRLNTVLDERRRPAADPLLAAHAADCDDCRQLLSLQAALFDGLSQRVSLSPARDFTERVVALAGREMPVLVAKHRSGRTWLALGAVLASAALMLLAVSLVRIARRGDTVAANGGERNTFVGQAPRQPSRLAMTQPGPNRKKGAPRAAEGLSGADWLIEAPRLPNRLRGYRNAIDDLVVSWPEAASRLDEMERVAPGLRPLRASFSIIWEALSFTNPTARQKPTTPPSSPTSWRWLEPRIMATAACC